jgi:CheY-like chemotaxis protein
LVKKLVELHEGAITASSDGPGTGCTFTITLPVHDGDRDGTGEPASETARPLRILVIDDNKDLAIALKKRLEGLGHEITLAHDGPDGIIAAKRTNPHAVLVDVGLPSMDGYRVADELRHENLPEMRIAAISGFKERGEESLAAERFDHYFLKPVDAESLNAWLARVANELGTSDGVT